MISPPEARNTVTPVAEQGHRRSAPHVRPDRCFVSSSAPGQPQPALVPRGRPGLRNASSGVGRRTLMMPAGADCGRPSISAKRTAARACQASPRPGLLHAVLFRSPSKSSDLRLRSRVGATPSSRCLCGGRCSVGSPSCPAATTRDGRVRAAGRLPRLCVRHARLVRCRADSAPSALGWST
jgi:hypothetical protein